MYPMLPCSLDCPFLLPLRCSLIFICHVSCVPYVACFFRLSFFIAPSVFSNIYLFCVLCTLYCQFLWIVFFIAPSVLTKKLFVLCLVYPILPVSLDCSFFLPLRYSLTFICPVSGVPYFASFSGLSFFLLLRYSLTFICLVSDVPYVASFSGLSFFIAPSVFSNIYLSCVLCTLCCLFL
jgi:hypothetical protein